jgi:hypothetical protein
MSLQDQINAGERAKLLLEDSDIKAAFAQIEGAIVEQWADLAVENKAQAEELKRLLWAARQFKSIFEVTIAGGHFAKNELLADNAHIRAEAARNRINGTH